MDGKVWRSLVPEACCRYVYTNLHIMTWLAPLSPICLILALGLHLTCYISFHALSAAERRNVIHFKPFFYFEETESFFLLLHAVFSTTLILGQTIMYILFAY